MKSDETNSTDKVSDDTEKLMNETNKLLDAMAKKLASVTSKSDKKKEKADKTAEQVSPVQQPTPAQQKVAPVSQAPTTAEQKVAAQKIISAATEADKPNKESKKPQKAKKKNALSICGLILCAGSGSRTELGYNKMLYYVGKKTILELTLDRFRASNVTSLMLVVSPTDKDAITKLVGAYENVSICIGGSTRFESVKNGLTAIAESDEPCDVVCIHDGARPHVNAKTINESIEAALEYGSGIVAVPTTDTIKVIENDKIIKNLARQGLYNIQTPQTFLFDMIKKAYDEAKNGSFTDDSEVYAKAGYTPHIVVGEYENIKVTSPNDLYTPTQGRSKIGVGFDVHRLVAGRPLILGGVRIPFNKGLKGHSDADVLIHAIMDALLSAGGFPDIGVLFPDTDDQYKDISSVKLLVRVRDLLRRRGFVIGNVSAVIMAEKPKMEPYIQFMRESLAVALQINPTQINVSATTTEQLGIIGEEQGIATSATCLLFY